MEKLTPKQKEVLDFISQSVSESGFSPTIRDIAKTFRISIGPVQRHVKALVRKGYLRHTPGKSRGIHPASHKPLAPVPVIGWVHAGNLSEAIENPEGYIHVDKDVLKSGEYFALKVKGDSMTGSGIYEGDLIVVRRQPTAEHNDIVVAMVDDEAAVKKLVMERGLTYLESANPKYKPIYARTINIVGKVVYLARSYTTK